VFAASKLHIKYTVQMVVEMVKQQYKTKRHHKNIITREHTNDSQLPVCRVQIPGCIPKKPPGFIG